MGSEAERLLEAVREIAPAISARAAEIEAGRRLPLDLVKELRAIGVFRMLVPRSHGGLEIDFPTSVDILAELAAADGATGWTVMIGCETPQLFALLPRASFDAVYAGGPDVICGGAFAPQGTRRASTAAGGYRVSGRWGFASGCQHADWLFGNCVVTQNGVARAGTDPRRADSCAAWCCPRRAGRSSTPGTPPGMRGTGSHDIALARRRGRPRSGPSTCGSAASRRSAGRCSPRRCCSSRCTSARWRSASPRARCAI